MFKKIIFAENFCLLSVNTLLYLIFKIITLQITLKYYNNLMLVKL